MKTALCDVDGVLVGFTPQLLRLVGGRVKEDAIVTWDIFEYLDANERECAELLLSAHKFWSDLPRLDGAVHGVERLRQSGYRVKFVTSPWYGCHSWEMARRELLKRFFSAEKKDCVITADKADVHGDLFIDDKAGHVIAWNKAYVDRTNVVDAKPPGIVFDAPYNQGVVGYHRMKGWSDLDRVLKEIE